ncbi:MAG: hypothetical protein V9G19_15915 [Tetrasphaera sp.]
MRATAIGRIGRFRTDAPNAKLTGAILRHAKVYRWDDGTGRSAPTRSSERAWRLVADNRDGGIRWLRTGAIPGRPGNAHTGWIYSSVDYTTVPPGPALVAQTLTEWNDWQCTAGARPPAFATSSSSCTLLRVERGGNRGELTPARVGLHGIDIAGRLPTQVWTTSTSAGSSAALDVGVRPVGDPFRDRGYYARTATETAASISSAATGRLGVIDLDDPRASVTGEGTSSWKVWQR